MRITAVEADGDTYLALRTDGSLRGGTGIVVDDAASAAAALRLALDGASLVIHAVAPRAVLDRLYEDLRRIGPVEVVTAARPPGPGDLLDKDARELLRLLAQGLTLNDAADALHLSLRTANRRLADARRTLGVTTTLEAIATLSAGSTEPG
jgi:DNA-binding NarL/FixJ family response regulator